MKKSKQTKIMTMRLALGWSQRKLAERATLSQRTIWAIERGEPVRVKTQRSILAALKIPFERRNEFFLDGGSLSRVAA